jgi:RHS repeat-associated protein
MFHPFLRRVVLSARTQPSTERFSRPRLAAVPIRLCCLAVIAISLASSSAVAQTAEFTQGNKGSNAVTMQVPLGNYPGRGVSLPVSLNYSTQGLWRIGFINSVYVNTYVGPLRRSVTEAIYAEHSTAGWHTSLDVPKLEWPQQNDVYKWTGTPYAQGWINGYTYRIARVFIHMPDGSTHELRRSDQVYSDSLVEMNGTFYAVDGSRMRYDGNADGTGVLYLSDGTRYILNGGTTQYIDRNGNTLNYNGTNRQWTDTLGRVINMPWPANPGAGDYTYSLPGINGSSITYTLKFRGLSDVFVPDVSGQTQKPIGDYYLPDPYSPPSSSNLPQPTGTSTNFVSAYTESDETQPGYEQSYTYVVGRGQSGAATFNPVVLAEIDLPNGQSYQFKYNAYGELDKVIYPFGGYQRHQYNTVATIGSTTAPYTEGTRGMVSRWISPSGTGSDEAQWTYSGGTWPLTVTAPDASGLPNGTRSETYLFYPQNNQSNNFAYVDARNGMPVEERIYAPASQGGAMLRRTLIDYDQSSASFNRPSPATGTYTAYRNPRPIKTVSLILDTGGNALASTTTTGYDTTYQFSVGPDATSSSQYDFASVDRTTAQTGAISSIPFGPLLRSTQTAYLTGDANYRGRNILDLPTSATIYDAGWTIVAQSTITYDESSYPLLTYGAVTGWNDPGTSVRGNATSHASWLNTTNTWLTTHAQYDQCGSARSAWDAKGNQSQVEYSSTYAYAFPTSTHTAVPDPTGQYGSTSAFQSTSVFDFNTGLATSATNANGFTSVPEYNDPLLRPTRAVHASGNAAQTQGIIQYDDVGRTVTAKSDLTTFNDNALQAKTIADPIGRTIETRTYESDTNYIAVQTQYDSLGRAYKVSNPFRPWQSESPVWTTSAFDALGRVTSLTTPDGAVVQTAYGASTSGTLGTLVTVTDQAGKKRRSLTDALGRVIRVDEPDANGNLDDQNGVPVQSTNYLYDALGNLRQVTQGAQQRFFMYDSFSRLIRARNPEQGTNPSLDLTDSVTGNSSWCVGYSYDDNGNLTQRTDARGVVATYLYDALNRNYSVTYSNDPANTPAVTRYYDSATNGKGRIYQTVTSGTKATKVTINSFDALGRPLSLTQQMKRTGMFWGPAYQIQRAYDLAGHVLSQTYPSGHVVNYNYDLAGRLGDKVPGSQMATELAFSGNLGDGVTRAYASAISYDDASRMQEERYGTLTPLYHKQRFNQRGQLWDMRLSTVTFASDSTNGDRGAIVNYYSNNFQPGVSGTDNNGNLLRQESFVPGSDYFQQNYGYDSLNRLSSVSELKNGQTSNFTQGYSFDQWGNRTIDQTGTTANAGINNLACWIDPNTNRLYASSDQGISDPTQRLIRYDAAGNQTSDYYGPTWTGSRVYDAENRMISATNSATNTTSNYTYDGDGHRVVRSDPIAGGAWQVYGMDGELLAEYNFNGAAILPQKEYGYRNGQLLITAASGDSLRLWNFMKNAAVRFGVYGSPFGDSQILSATFALSNAAAQGQSQLLSAARTQVQNVVTWGSNVTNDSDFVRALYLSYLQRFPDPNELNAWVSLIPTIGRDGVRDGFAYSNEFAARVSNLWGTASSDTERTDAFVQYVYNGILHRSANGSEDANAISTLDNAGATGQANVIAAANDLARNLFNSAEYTSRPGLTPHDFVYDLYQTLYCSPPDNSWDYWTDQVGANWENKQTVLEHFINAGPFALKTGTLCREVLWLVPDQLGTPRMIAERTGSLAGIKRHDYLPFGEELYAGTGGRTQQEGYNTDNVRQHFTGYENDLETGLNFAQARYQSPVQGRFTSVDPLMASASVFDPQSLNRYSYVQNNPTNFTDPTGMMLSDIGVYQTNDPEEAATLQKKSDSDFQRAINAGYAREHGGTVSYDKKDGHATFIGKGSAVNYFRRMLAIGGGVTVSAKITSIANDSPSPDKPKFEPGRVYVCTRHTRFNGVFSIVNGVAVHYWLRTDEKEAGLGDLNGDVPGGASEMTYVTWTAIVDHHGQSEEPGASCEVDPNADPKIVNRLLEIGKPMGRFTLTNNCWQFVNNVLSEADAAKRPVPRRPTFADKE